MIFFAGGGSIDAGGDFRVDVNEDDPMKRFRVAFVAVLGGDIVDVVISLTTTTLLTE